MGFRAFAIASLLLAVASPAWAANKNRLRVVPVTLLGYVGDKLEVSVQKPCGSEFLGLVASPGKDSRLRLAAAVRAGDVMCTSMPEEERVLINYIATRSFKTIAPMDVSDWKGRFVVNPIRDLRLFDQKKERGKALQGVYNTKCGQHVGTLIHQTDTKQLEVAFIEHLVRGSRTTDCPREQKVRRIQAVDLGPGLKVGAYREMQPPAEFQLRLAKIDGNSFRRLEKGGVSFQYLRQCNEAPIGIVVGKRSRAKQRTSGGARLKRQSLGMLVAHYPGLDCSSQEAAEAWTTYSTRDVFVPRGWQIRVMAPTQPSENLTLKSPLEMAKLNKQKRKGLYVDFISGCDLTIGAVYARSLWAASENVLAVGVLSRKAGNQCKKRVTQASLFQPFVSRQVPVTDMFPLRIQGATAH